MHLLKPNYRPVQQARPQSVGKYTAFSTLRSVRSSSAAPVSPPCLALVPRPRYQLADHSSFVARGAKDGLDAELEATQQTLDKVLQAVQAAQAAQNQAGQMMQQTAAAGATVQESALISREQQLWDRQAALLDRMQQQWDQERQAFLAREQQLLSELTQLRQELSQLLLKQVTAAAAAAPGHAQIPAAAVAPGSSVGSSPSAAVAAAGLSQVAAAASSAASRLGTSASPGQGVMSGPNSASAAVAAAIRAVRDEGLTPTPAASSDGDSVGSWQDLFSASGDKAVSSVASALAAVNSTDVLSDLDLSFNSSSSSSRGRQRLDGSNGNGSNGSSLSSTTAVDEPPSSSSGGSTVSMGSSTVSGPDSSSSIAPVEVQKGDPQGPPPLLAVGDDDIFWVAKLHDGLLSAGYYPSDDEVENWMFADGTQTALLTFQACNGLPETGVTCEATWRQLLGDDTYESSYGHLSRQSSSSSSNGGNGGGSSVATTETADGEVVYSFGTDNASSSGSSSGPAVGSSSSSVRIGGSGWPVVMDMDGGKEVHVLQVCLQRAGYSCGDDEMRWWQFGSATLDALKTFQACQGLPESGVCDERTWLALLGPDATPEALDEVRGDESIYEDDMSAPHEGAVWLVGEQRWSKPAN